MKSSFTEEETDTPSQPSGFIRHSMRSIKDPVHDYIPIDDIVSAFVDTRQFQRLRAIKQLGTSYYVWPGASHNRFEHCLGVAHLARLMAEHLQKSQPELGITPRDVQCVQLAGLCHDLGHGPWSHVWDSLFIPTALKNKRWKHEDASEMMFDDLIKKNGIQIPDEDAEFIKALIAGEPTRSGDGAEKRFLFDIVANKRNGIDVDKFDYISRDCHAIGEKGNLSLTRLIHSARVIDNQLCYDIKDANQLYELCYTRFSLHKRIYNHKTAKAIEYMIIDALLAAEPYMKLAEQVDNPDEYVYLTDDIMATIERTKSPEFEQSRAIFDRIRTRDLYRMVDYKVFEWEYRERCREYITPERIADAAQALSRSRSPDPRAKTEHVLAKDIIVDLCPMHYGMQEKNPLDFINFYSKHNPNKCSVPGPGDISLLMPAVFGEILLRVYTRDARFYGVIQAGYREVLQTMSITDEVDLTTVTRPATEAPSTPRSHTRNRSFGTPLPGSMTRSNNSFMTVPPDHAPTSPSHKVLKNKRDRDISTERAAGSSKKKRGD
ncbi:hypothetical protein PILCRDRAFT_608246 [Piloderma croceum F 1598]|uniref:HD domain-containing protein n=1 Tax=Piloderma croceum (strain F 1598) TaxID=765440 RepID=A0A0C3EZN2_PILCF|nr:hypothetical protein PILCRDRAFT_608246 [Piloderma croceum F 1598]